MKKFEELTTEQKYKRLKKQYYGLEASKFLSIIAPFIIVGAINFEDYFTTYNGVKMSMGCILALFVGGIAMWNEVKKGEGKTSQRISGVVGWAIALALTWLFNSILQDLLLIVFAGFCGQLVGAGFELGADSKLELAKKYQSADINSNAMSNAITNALLGKKKSSSNKKKSDEDETNVGDILG